MSAVRSSDRKSVSSSGLVTSVHTRPCSNTLTRRRDEVLGELSPCASLVAHQPDQRHADLEADDDQRAARDPHLAPVDPCSLWWTPELTL